MSKSHYDFDLAVGDVFTCGGGVEYEVLYRKDYPDSFPVQGAADIVAVPTGLLLATSKSLMTFGWLPNRRWASSYTHQPRPHWKNFGDGTTPRYPNSVFVTVSFHGSAIKIINTIYLADIKAELLSLSDPDQYEHFLISNKASAKFLEKMRGKSNAHFLVDYYHVDAFRATMQTAYPEANVSFTRAMSAKLEYLDSRQDK